MTEREQEYCTERMVRALVECNKLTQGCVTTGHVARGLKMTARQLYRKLEERGVLFRDSGMWMLMSKYSALDLLRYRYTLYFTMQGERKVRVYPVWTERGEEFIQCIMHNA